MIHICLLLIKVSKKLLFLAQQLDGAQGFVLVYLKVGPICRSMSTTALVGSAN